MISKNEKEIILGIDPGFAIVGYGIVEKSKNGDLKMIEYGAITTMAKLPFPARLAQVHRELKEVIKEYKPNKMAVEELFFSKNVKTAIEVGQARGVIMLTGIQAGLPIEEYTPLQIKQAVASYGRAEKKQVQEMVKMLLKLKEIPRPDDAADALAVAICCANSSNHYEIN
ncbi:crossover junction endodeoxyribonuclease RuvC [Candidatus Falkowbacteria bacterium]|jgi:crossover junction endodeoxyribonuclease RuvC|nr:crossover junction endodeoxyribonuclease RuvC [Candidatus Falkowbacteria bacterium]MBT4433259.1 crossover junction endodeoxyribonuclease RuvC [Candidatus Falkowbacteria bacterium]